MTDEDAPTNQGGRPLGSATGQTKLRTIKLGPLWDHGQTLARARGKTMTAHVEEALRRENARVERLLDREVRPDPNHACAAHDDAHLGQRCPDLTA